MGPASVSAEAEHLPHVDEHTAVLDADVEEVWTALLRVVEASFSSRATAPIARALGCLDSEASGPRPLAPGSTCPGFHVASAERPSELALAGRHRFSSYALIFRLEALGAGRTRLRAETRAEFHGLKGRIYRSLVIGSRGHVLVTRGMLSAVERRAVKPDRDGAEGHPRS
jgi:hypothetical protein